MSEIYVSRKITPESLLNSIPNQIILLQSEDKSGLSYFLKHTTRFFNSEELTSFYISGSEQIAKQIFKQIFNAVTIEEVEQKISKYSKKEVILTILKTMVYPLDNIPFIPNIGSTIVNIIECINSTINVDIMHYEDYRLERALLEYLDKINPNITLVIDNITEENIEFLKLLIERKINLIFAVPIDKHKQEKIFKLLSIAEIIQPKIWEQTFLRPDESETYHFFQEYQATIDEQILSKIKSSEFSIHAIMSCINKYDFEYELSKYEQIILCILKQLNCSISMELLNKLSQNYLQKTGFIFNGTEFSNIIERLKKNGFLSVLDTNNVKLSDAPLFFNQDLIEEVILINTLIETRYEPNELSVEICEYAIKNINRNSRKKNYYILKLLQLKGDKISSEYLLELSISQFDNLSQVLAVGRLLYNRFYFKETFRLLEKHSDYNNDRNYQLFYTLVKERLRLPNHIDELLSLIESSKNTNEQCLLLSNLFVAYINNNNSNGYREIIHKDGKFFYRNYITSPNYSYLLRNVAFYLPFKEGIEAYRAVLEFFNEKDLINYNRTLSNYICFLMEHRKERLAIQELESLKPKIKQILLLKDIRYEYLYNNFSLYLMNFTDENPISYLNMISEDESGSETPFIYSKINLALYYAKISSPMANTEFSEAKELVNKSPIPQTKRFFEINQLLYLYMRNVNIYNYLENLDTTPFRNSDTYVEDLAIKYLEKLDNHEEYMSKDWEYLFCPGYLFYRYYDVKLLINTELYF